MIPDDTVTGTLFEVKICGHANVTSLLTVYSLQKQLIKAKLIEYVCWSGCVCAYVLYTHCHMCLCAFKVDLANVGLRFEERRVQTSLGCKQRLRSSKENVLRVLLL